MHKNCTGKTSKGLRKSRNPLIFGRCDLIIYFTLIEILLVKIVLFGVRVFCENSRFQGAYKCRIKPLSLLCFFLLTDNKEHFKLLGF